MQSVERYLKGSWKLVKGGFGDHFSAFDELDLRKINRDYYTLV